MRTSEAAAGRSTIDLPPVWTVRDVARFLRCSDDKAARWLNRRGVQRYDIGEGSRELIRVRRADVERAFAACAVTAASRPGADVVGGGDKPRGLERVGYVPKYSADELATPAVKRPRRRRAG